MQESSSERETPEANKTPTHFHFTARPRRSTFLPCSATHATRRGGYSAPVHGVLRLPISPIAAHRASSCLRGQAFSRPRSGLVLYFNGRREGVVEENWLTPDAASRPRSTRFTALPQALPCLLGPLSFSLLLPKRMPREKGMAFWGFFDGNDGGPAPDVNGFPYYSAAGPGALASSSLSPPSCLAPAGAGRGGVKEENGSRSMTDHLHAVSGGDVGGGEDGEAAPELGHHGKRKRPSNARHTPRQIQELQALFEQCPHPDEKQRAALGKRVRLQPSQVKFWFQNRRTQLKRESLLHENRQLMEENGKLRAENLSLREAMTHPVCGGCGGPFPAMLDESPSLEEDLRVQNATLKNELSRFCALASVFLGRSISFVAAPPTPGSPVERIGSVPATTAANSTVTEFTGSPSSQTMGMAITTMAKAGIDRSVFLELATSAMDELVKMAQMDEPLWIPNVPLPGSLAKETLNHEVYSRTFSPSIGVKPPGFVSEASRESGIVSSDGSVELVETLLDEVALVSLSLLFPVRLNLHCLLEILLQRRWSRFFSCIIAESSIIEEISTGAAGSRDGALLLMQAKLQVLSPLVPVREVAFLRFCKQLGEGLWAVVDVSIDGLGMEQGLAVASTTANMNCRRLPSGCVVQDTPNGFCKVTWVEHTVYHESSVHQLYRPLLRSGLALGAGRWLATLQRQFDCLDVLMPKQDSSDAMLEGSRSLLRLAERMMDNFCAGVSASSAEWSKLDGFTGSIGEDVRIMARRSVDEPGVPAGVVLCAATSVWMLVTPKRLFNFLCNERTRVEWDILSKGGPMQEVTKIYKGQQNGNAVSLLKATAPNTQQDSSILILQETCTDASSSTVVYSPVDIPAMRRVMGGEGDPTSIMLLPSGFVILPGGPSMSGDDGHKTCGSLLTVAFQILGNRQPTGKLTVESVQTVDSLISCTINRIKTALRCDA
ncbi:homeobox-leucine zipper protein ROC4 isoform X1 [Triticum aestivum]|uniref:homeobox-leucine zipper protein ROC4 isoform X1 n=1 Tax=Triticum aestivum TaxID=4565 RepID=UPI001D014366|nr:homeobox-leucine zipper protein ROC4-like isoform X1 [Triticum aestivum]